jgi:hypothetical protein
VVVLPGVPGGAELGAAPHPPRPAYLAADLSALLEPQPAVESDSGPDARTEVGGWCALVRDGNVEVTGDGTRSDWWRALAACAWTHLDRCGEPVGAPGIEMPG